MLLSAAVASAQSRDISVDGMRAEKRVALVIGNSAYPISPLRNPVNDARAMAERLRGVGFDVLMYENVSQKALRLAIIEFGDRLEGGGVGLFFFAGHGLQVAGRNYMVPVDAVIKSEREVEVESLDVASVLARMETAKTRVNIVILDACRNNPFERSFRGMARGLASIDAPSGTLIAYATAPGRVSRDGDGPNGPYTSELLKALQEPGLKVEEVFKRVTRAVRLQTKGEQVPWVASSIDGDFIFVFPPMSVAAASSQVEDNSRQQRGDRQTLTEGSRTADEERNVQEQSERPQVEPRRADAAERQAREPDEKRARLTAVPLLSTPPSDPPLPAEITKWLGSWEGRWHNGAAHRLIVQSIGRPDVKGVYSVQVTFHYDPLSTSFGAIIREVNGTLEKGVLKISPRMGFGVGEVATIQYAMTSDEKLSGMYSAAPRFNMPGLFTKRP